MLSYKDSKLSNYIWFTLCLENKWQKIFSFLCLSFPAVPCFYSDVFLGVSECSSCWLQHRPTARIVERGPSTVRSPGETVPSVARSIYDEVTPSYWQKRYMQRWYTSRVSSKVESNICADRMIVDITVIETRITTYNTW